MKQITIDLTTPKRRQQIKKTLIVGGAVLAVVTLKQKKTEIKQLQKLLGTTRDVLIRSDWAATNNYNWGMSAIEVLELSGEQVSKINAKNLERMRALG